MALLQFDEKRQPIATTGGELDLGDGGDWVFLTERLQVPLEAETAFVKVKYTAEGDTARVVIDVDSVALAFAEAGVGP